MPPNKDLRPEISVSWWRSQLLGVKPDIPIEGVPLEPLLDADERLRRALSPVLDELVTKLAGTNSAIVLADHRAVILDRRGTTRAVKEEMDRLAILPGYAFGEGSVGTNGVGTAMEERRFVRVAGHEHYAEIFKHLSCLGVPLVHPLNRKLMGVLDLTFPHREEHPLMISFMQDAGRQIEGLLAEWASLRERAQFECFLALARRSHRPVLSTMDDAVLLNRFARALHPVDQAALLRAVGDFGEAEHGAVLDLTIGAQGESVSVRVHTRSDRARFQGVVLELLPSQPRRSRGRRAGTLPGLVGRAAAWNKFCAELSTALDANAPVLLMGEAGAGKLAAAQSLHKAAGREQLLIFDVATVLADGRAEWLRALREDVGDSRKTVVLRHLELADPPLCAAIAAEIDRCPKAPDRLLATLTLGPLPDRLQPLLDRFSVQLVVPPLRERRDDIEPLVRHFTARHGAPSMRFHPESLAILREANFPGNVRELENLVSGVIAAGRRGDVLPADLPTLSVAGPARLSQMERAERDAVIEALRLMNGNKASAAAQLGIARATLYRKIAAYGIEQV